MLLLLSVRRTVVISPSVSTVFVLEGVYCSLINGNHTFFFSSSYRESAERISKSVKQLPRSPVKEAADWVEYTQAQGGLQYLRPRGLDLPFYQLYLLDILFLVFVVLAVALFVIRFLLKSVVSCLSGSSRKEKAN